MPRPRKTPVVLLALIAVVCLGCLDPWADSFTKAKVTIKDIAGRYDISDAYGKLKKDSDGAVISLDLREDGSCTMTVIDQASSRSRELTWSLEKDNVTTAVFVRDGDRGGTFNITGEKPPFELLLVKDVDSADAYRLKKTPTP